MSRRRQLTMAAISGVPVVLAVAFAIVASSGDSSGKSGAPYLTATSPFDGAALPAGTRAPDFRLTDQTGHTVSLSILRGQTVVLAFPYASCGAPCVVVGQQIRGALDELSRAVPVVLISADPKGDTPANVRRYLASVSLGGRVSYLTGTPAELRKVWRAYHVTPASAGRKAFAGAASVVLIDAQGDERVVFGEEQLTAESLAHDILRLGHP